jgi:hypothetical protein
MKSYTDLEQSKKLAEFLPLESADMYYFLDPTPAGNIYHLTVQRVDIGIKNLPHYDEGDIPCWSLAALLDVLPQILCLKPILDLEECSIQYSGTDLYVVANNPVDACYEMILKLHELKLL